MPRVPTDVQESFDIVGIYNMPWLPNQLVQIDGSSISLGNSLYACHIAGLIGVDNLDANFESLRGMSLLWVKHLTRFIWHRDTFVYIDQVSVLLPSSGIRLVSFQCGVAFINLPNRGNFLPKSLDQIPDTLPIPQCLRKVSGIRQAVEGTPIAASWAPLDFE